MTSKNANRLFALGAFIFLFFLTATIVSGIISQNHYRRAKKQIEFLEEVERAATVDAAEDALERGMPLLEKHFAGSMELRILQSNLDYLQQQPPHTLVPSAIEESISVNSDRIHNEFTSSEPWDSIFFFSIWVFGFMVTMLIISILDM